MEQSSSSYKLEIKINTWNFPRFCIVTPEAIKLQIATCYPCPTCEKRVIEARKTLSTSIKSSENLKNSSFSFEFPTSQAKSTKIEDILAFISQALPSYEFRVLSGPDPYEPPSIQDEFLSDILTRQFNAPEKFEAKEIPSYSLCIKINTWNTPRQCLVLRVLSSFKSLLAIRAQHAT